jgi:hypothetical protein
LLLSNYAFIILKMISGRRKTIIIFLTLFLIAIVYIWLSVNKTWLYINNSFHKTLCFYINGEFITLVPAHSAVELRLKSRKNALIGIRERLDGIPLEEFTVNMGGKSFIYNISDFSDAPKEIKMDGNKAVLQIGGKIPENPVQRITLDTLHRMIMNKLPRKMETLRRFSQADGIKMAGDIGDISSMNWILAILKLPEHRAVWDEALRSIGKLGGNNAVNILKTYLKHTDMDIAFAAIDSLSGMQSASAQITLMDAYRVTDSNKLQKAILDKFTEMPLSFDIKVFYLGELEKAEMDKFEMLLDIVGKKKIKEAVPLLKKIKARNQKLSRETLSLINQTIKKIESKK